MNEIEIMFLESQCVLNIYKMGCLHKALLPYPKMWSPSQGEAFMQLLENHSLKKKRPAKYGGVDVYLADVFL